MSTIVKTGSCRTTQRPCTSSSSSSSSGGDGQDFWREPWPATDGVYPVDADGLGSGTSGAIQGGDHFPIEDGTSGTFTDNYGDEVLVTDGNYLVAWRDSPTLPAHWRIK